MQRETIAYSPLLVAENPPDMPNSSALVFLAICWIVSGLSAASPLANSVPIKLLLLVPPFAMSVLLTLLNPRDGFTLWSISIGFLVTQTGYQLPIGDVLLSALELVLIFLLLFLIWHNRNSGIASVQHFKLPGYAFLITFVGYSFIMIIVSWVRGVSFLATMIEFKGFILYPFVPYIMVFGLRNMKIVRFSIIIVVAWYVYVAARGVLQFIRNRGVDSNGYVFRSSGDYASINTYGITLLAICLLVIGIAIYAVDWRVKALFFMVSLWLFAGAVTSVSRTIWIAGGAAILLLLLYSRKRKYAVIILMVGLVFFLLLPGDVVARLDQISDSSTEKRSLYLEAGMQAWKARWLTGWGWGTAFWAIPGGGLVSNPSGLAWYHNDYLNLATQTGAIGLVLYVGYWLRTLIASIRWQNVHVDSPISGCVSGCQMALVSLLVSAFFEHVLWKPDIAGLVGWVAGLMFTCMYLQSHTDQITAEV